MRAILTYHSIDDSGSPISCTVENFDRHVHWFTSGRIEVTTIERLVGLPPSSNAVAITFDDGYENVAEHALPRLSAHGLPSTIFVVTDRVGTTNVWDRGEAGRIPQLPLLGWNDLARVASHDVVLGSHGRSHADLTTLDQQGVEQEVSGSADVVESQTGSRPTAFAYPYGRLDQRVAAAVARVYSYGCTTEFGPLEGGVSLSVLPRLDAHYFRGAGLLETWGTPKFERFVARRRMLRDLRAVMRGTAARGAG